MARGGLAALGLLCSVGCAISDVQRMNQRLKEDNSRLLQENRSLQAKAEAAHKDVVDRDMEIQRLKEQLAAYERGRPAPAAAQVVPRGAFDVVPDVEVIEDKTGTRVVLSDQVFFSSGSSELTERGKKTLVQVADILKAKYRGLEIRIEGHTDNEPIKATRAKYPSNWELSCDRASAVLRFLESKGVDPRQMHVEGWAFHKPVAANETTAGRQKNRRVEIVILR
ncbi:MAG: OmpA family protein [Planctomycetes bacterium]|nr:OmpA family protein [Planctomycetota bacterium]